LSKSYILTKSNKLTVIQIGGIIEALSDFRKSRPEGGDVHVYIGGLYCGGHSRHSQLLYLQVARPPLMGQQSPKNHGANTPWFFMLYMQLMNFSVRLYYTASRGKVNLFLQAAEKRRGALQFIFVIARSAATRQSTYTL
jgi:hypothetical protein